MNIRYQELYAWKLSKDANVMLVFLWIVAHSQGYKAEYSLRKIESDTGVSIRSVRTAIDKLISEGVVTHETTHQKSVITIWRFVDYAKGKPPKATHKTTHEEIDRTSFVAAEHLDKWKEWIKYRGSIRKQFATTATAQANYKKLIEMSTVTVTDYTGMSTQVVDNNKLNSIIDNTIANQYQGLVPPKNYGYNNSINTGRTTQQDAERIAAEHAVDAAQSSFDAEQRKAELRASIGLLG